MANNNKVIINGKEFSFFPEETILEVAQRNGVFIPTLCHLKDTTPTGACRICMVEVEGARSLVASCAAPAADGMIIQTESEEVVRSRKLTISLLLSMGHHDCLLHDYEDLARPAYEGPRPDCYYLDLGRHAGLLRLIQAPVSRRPRQCQRLLCTKPVALSRANLLPRGGAPTKLLKTRNRPLKPRLRLLNGWKCPSRQLDEIPTAIQFNVGSVLNARNYAGDGPAQYLAQSPGLGERVGLGDMARALIAGRACMVKHRAVFPQHVMLQVLPRHGRKVSTD